MPGNRLCATQGQLKIPAERRGYECEHQHIAANSFVLKMLDNPSFKEKIKQDKLERFVDEEWVKKIYRELAKSDEYAKAYITKRKTHTSAQKKK